MSKASNFLKYTMGGIAVLYPVLIFYALKNHISLKYLAGFLGVLVLAGFLRHQKKGILCAGLCLSGIVFIFENALFLKIYPVLMSGAFLYAFASSLRQKIPLIGVFALKMGYHLDAKGQQYARKATWAWSFFLAFNTLMAFYSLFASETFWMLYNGLISYLLIGTMLACEYLIRKRITHVH